LLNIFIWPAKELDNGSLLSTLVIIGLINLRSLPNEIGLLYSDLEIFSIAISGDDNKR
jgi:hypothetical protein